MHEAIGGRPRLLRLAVLLLGPGSYLDADSPLLPQHGSSVKSTMPDTSWQSYGPMNKVLENHFKPFDQYRFGTPPVQSRRRRDSFPIETTKCSTHSASLYFLLVIIL